MRAADPKITIERKMNNLERRLDPSLDLGERTPLPEEKSPADELSGKFSIINQLEVRVTMIQIARFHIEKVIAELDSIKHTLDERKLKPSKYFSSPQVINHFLKERLGRMREIAQTAQFQGQILLDGDAGVTGSSSLEALRFIRGSSKVVPSRAPGYPVTIYQDARPSTLLGIGEISSENLRNESLIALADGKHEVRYKVKNNESPQSLVQNLQKSMLDQGLNIRVLRTRQNRLFFVHNQLGTETFFRGLSSKTNIISSTPGRSNDAARGRDISGTIGLEKAHGIGGFLMGAIGNRRTDGLVLHYDGAIRYPGQIIGYIHVKQKGVNVPIDLQGEQTELLNFPSLLPVDLAIGVANHSHFSDLEAIRGNSDQECRDTLKLVYWAEADLDQLLEDLRWKEDSFLHRTIGILRNSVMPRIAGEEIMMTAQNKAGEMKRQLQEMMSSTQFFHQIH